MHSTAFADFKPCPSGSMRACISINFFFFPELGHGLWMNCFFSFSLLETWLHVVRLDTCGPLGYMSMARQ